MRSLSSHFSFISPTWLRQTVEERKFRLAHEARRALSGGKAFWMGVFRRE